MAQCSRCGQFTSDIGVAGCGRVDGDSLCCEAAASRNAECCRDSGVGPTGESPLPNCAASAALHCTVLCDVGKTRLLLVSGRRLYTLIQYTHFVNV